MIMELKNKKDLQRKSLNRVQKNQAVADSQEVQKKVARQVNNRLELHQVKISLKAMKIINIHRKNLSPSLMFKQDP